MEKHILIAISSEHSTSLHFVEHFFRDYSQLRVTLAYVAQVDSRTATTPGRQPDVTDLLALDAASRQRGQAYLDTGRAWFASHGCACDHITTKLLPARASVVEVIVEEAHNGLYDAVVLGRRGLSWLEELVSDSVSQRILWQDIDFPVWFVANDLEPRRRDVLLCVDGTEPSVRIADHVGFILANEPDHRVTLLTVKPDTAQPDHRDEARQEQAITALLDNGFPEERITTKVIQSTRPAEAILAEAEAGGYAVVAAGRRGGKPTALERLRNSSVSEQLLQRLSKFALWISR